MMSYCGGGPRCPESSDGRTRGGGSELPSAWPVAGVDRLWQRWGLVRCLDEIFLPRGPILMAVAPHSMAWVTGQRGPDRSGESWGEV